MLKTQSKIHGDIINAWSTVLNFNEQYRDMNSSGRFFFGLNAVVRSTRSFYFVLVCSFHIIFLYLNVGVVLYLQKQLLVLCSFVK